MCGCGCGVSVGVCEREACSQQVEKHLVTVDLLHSPLFVKVHIDFKPLLFSLPRSSQAVL